MEGWARSEEWTLAPILTQQAEMIPDKTLFFVEGRASSYRDVEGISNAFARGYTDLGVQHGETVATLMLNCEDIVYSWFACSKLGAVHVPMLAQWSDQLVEQLQTARAKVAIADASLAAQLVASSGVLPHLRHIIVRPNGEALEPGQLDRGEGNAEIRLHSLADFLEADRAELPQASPARWDDLCTILFTGGTTGRSKGVAMSHNYVVSMATAAARQVDFGPNSVAFQPSPLCHVGATVGAVLCPLLQGGTGATELQFDPSTYWDRTRAYGATNVSLRMPMIVMLLAEPPGDGNSDNPVRYSTAPQIPRDVRREFEDRFDIQLVHSYANSEAIPMLVGTPADPPPPGRSGKPNPDMDVRLLDDHDREVQPGEVGEFCVRPLKPGIMFSEYYNNPEATAKAWRNLWFHTGDLGRIHEDGWWSVVDRKGDELRIGADIYSTFDIEGSVLQFPAVKESAVYTIDTPDGPAVKIDLRTTTPGLDYNGFVQFCAQKLPLVPRYIEVVNDFPRGNASRVQKYKLRRQGLTSRAWDRQTGDFCTTTVAQDRVGL